MGSNEVVSVSVVRDSSGQIDINETLNVCVNELTKLATNEVRDVSVIAEAVAKIWEDQPGRKNEKIDVVAYYAIQNLPTPPADLLDMQEQIKDYIRSVPQTYFIGKGKKGGVFPWARMNAEERASAETQRAADVARKAEKASLKAA